MLGKVQKIWPVLLSLFFVAVTWGVVKKTLDDHSETNREQNMALKQHSEKIAAIEATLSLLPEMRQDIKELVRSSARDRRERQNEDR